MSSPNYLRRLSNYVTLRSVLATSWKAKGLIAPVWHRMPVETERRDELARRLGTKGPSLSAINSGADPLTREMAHRIIAAASDVVPELSLLDLGAPEEVADDSRSPLLIARLEAVEVGKASAENVDAMFRVVAAAIDSLAKGDTRRALRLLSKAGVL